MAKEQIMAYIVQTELGGGSLYRVGLVNGSGQVFFKNLSGPQELHTIVDLLRNEKPIYYYPEKSLLVVGVEYVGEGDHTA